MQHVNSALSRHVEITPNGESANTVRNCSKNGPFPHIYMAKKSLPVGSIPSRGEIEEINKEFLEGKSRQTKERIMSFSEEAVFADTLGVGFNVAVTVAWETCLVWREGEGAAYLGTAPKERSAKFLRGLRNLAHRLGFEWVCIWIRAISESRGDHVHLFLYWPHGHWPALVDRLEAVTGVWQESGCLPVSVIAQAESGAGWDVRENLRGLEGAIYYGGYLGTQHEKRGHRAPSDRKSSGTSTKINKKARERAGFTITRSAA